MHMTEEGAGTNILAMCRQDYSTATAQNLTLVAGTGVYRWTAPLSLGEKRQACGHDFCSASLQGELGSL